MGSKERILSRQPHTLLLAGKAASHGAGALQELGPGVAISSWKKRWDSSQEPHRKRPLDDSALEVDAPGDPDTLEKVSRLPRDLLPSTPAGCLPVRAISSAGVQSLWTERVDRLINGLD